MSESDRASLNSPPPFLPFSDLFQDLSQLQETWLTEGEISSLFLLLASLDDLLIVMMNSPPPSLSPMGEKVTPCVGSKLSRRDTYADKPPDGPKEAGGENTDGTVLAWSMSYFGHVGMWRACQPAGSSQGKQTGCWARVTHAAQGWSRRWGARLVLLGGGVNREVSIVLPRLL